MMRSFGAMSQMASIGAVVLLLALIQPRWFRGFYRGGMTVSFHIGQVIGTNSGKDANGKATWWSNHHEGSVGLAVDF